MSTEQQGTAKVRNENYLCCSFLLFLSGSLYCARVQAFLRIGPLSVAKRFICTLRVSHKASSILDSSRICKVSFLLHKLENLQSTGFWLYAEYIFLFRRFSVVGNSVFASRGSLTLSSYM